MTNINSRPTGTLSLELSAAPTLVLGQALWRRRDVFKILEINQLKTLTDSAHSIINTFLTIPSSVAVHLPSSAYSTIWYGLLVLAKLTVLFHPDESQVASVVDNKGTRDRGLAIIQKFGEFSPGDNNVWGSSITVVRKLLSWLENSNAPSSSITFNNSSSHGNPIQLPQCQGSSQGESGQVGDNSVQQVMSPEHHVTSKGNTWDGLTDEFDDNLWQQMLDSFTWFGPAVESNFGCDDNLI